MFKVPSSLTREIREGLVKMTNKLLVNIKTHHTVLYELNCIRFLTTRG